MKFLTENQHGTCAMFSDLLKMVDIQLKKQVLLGD